MKKDYSVTSLAGALIWAAAMVLRRLSLPESGIITPILNVLPKFGVVLLIVGLTVTFWPHVFKKPFPPKGMYPLILLALLPVVLYKIVLPLIGGVDLVIYPWDYVASLLAAGYLAVAHALDYRKVAPDDASVDVAVEAEAPAEESVPVQADAAEQSISLEE